MAKITVGDVVIEGTIEELREWAELSGVEFPAVKKAEEPLKVGDKVRLISGGNKFPLHGYKKGEIYTVKNPEYSHVSGDKIQIIGGISTHGYATREQLQRVSAEDPEVNPLKVGDYAKVIEGAPDNIGVIVEITDLDYNEASLNPINSNFPSYSPINYLVKATDEEVAEAKAKLAPKFSVGEYAKVVGDTHWGGVEVGQIVKIDSELDGDGEHRFVRIADEYGFDYARPDKLEKVSDEVVADAKNIEKWAKIGRKLNEFKRGDIVEFTDDYVEMGEVRDVGSTTLGVVTKRKRGEYQAPLIQNVKLIAPVEARFDVDGE